MVRGLPRDLVIYVVLHTMVSSAFVLLGERRVDAYVSISILVYFIATSILPEIRAHCDLRLVDYALITVFTLIIALRVLDTLGYKLPLVSP
ncbi:hypothetical protein Desfe_0920 [Desulfurococcus amylolyticus DSM 16532]|uniref:Uncharacterized protein n=1 Tax=Desulfurococcus amylolyticus DSM 16532 TaxID=768672 RepID=I3XS84_DESAM|nr:hypothetical protein Desfe_0920 [Desulfurococcus amylolyticus DSM 16532]